jgi:hypothetical protein
MGNSEGRQDRSTRSLGNMWGTKKKQPLRRQTSPLNPPKADKPIGLPPRGIFTPASPHSDTRSTSSDQAPPTVGLGSHIPSTKSEHRGDRGHSGSFNVFKVRKGLDDSEDIDDLATQSLVVRDGLDVRHPTNGEIEIARGLTDWIADLLHHTYSSLEDPGDNALFQDRLARGYLEQTRYLEECASVLKPSNDDHSFYPLMKVADGINRTLNWAEDQSRNVDGFSETLKGLRDTASAFLYARDITAHTKQQAEREKVLVTARAAQLADQKVEAAEREKAVLTREKARVEQNSSRLQQQIASQITTDVPSLMNPFKDALDSAATEKKVLEDLVSAPQTFDIGQLRRVRSALASSQMRSALALLRGTNYEYFTDQVQSVVETIGNLIFLEPAASKRFEKGASKLINSLYALVTTAVSTEDDLRTAIALKDGTGVISAEKATKLEREFEDLNQRFEKLKTTNSHLRAQVDLFQAVAGKIPSSEGDERPALTKLVERLGIPLGWNPLDRNDLSKFLPTKEQVISASSSLRTQESQTGIVQELDVIEGYVGDPGMVCMYVHNLMLSIHGSADVLSGRRDDWRSETKVIRDLKNTLGVGLGVLHYVAWEQHRVAQAKRAADYLSKRGGSLDVMVTDLISREQVAANEEKNKRLLDRQTTMSGATIEEHQKLSKDLRQALESTEAMLKQSDQEVQDLEKKVQKSGQVSPEVTSQLQAANVRISQYEKSLKELLTGSRRLTAGLKGGLASRDKARNNLKLLQPVEDALGKVGESSTDSDKIKYSLDAGTAMLQLEKADRAARRQASNVRNVQTQRLQKQEVVQSVTQEAAVQTRKLLEDIDLCIVEQGRSRDILATYDSPVAALMSKIIRSRTRTRRQVPSGVESSQENRERAVYDLLAGLSVKGPDESTADHYGRLLEGVGSQSQEYLEVLNSLDQVRLAYGRVRGMVAKFRENTKKSKLAWLGNKDIASYPDAMQKLLNDETNKANNLSRKINALQTNINSLESTVRDKTMSSQRFKGLAEVATGSVRETADLLATVWPMFGYLASAYGECDTPPGLAGMALVEELQACEILFSDYSESTLDVDKVKEAMAVYSGLLIARLQVTDQYENKIALIPSVQGNSPLDRLVYTASELRSVRSSIQRKDLQISTLGTQAEEYAQIIKNAQQSVKRKDFEITTLRKHAAEYALFLGELQKYEEGRP